MEEIIFELGPGGWEGLMWVEMQGEECFQAEGTAGAKTQRAYKKSRPFSLAGMSDVPRGEWERKLERWVWALAQRDFNTVHNSAGERSHG